MDYQRKAAASQQTLEDQEARQSLPQKPMQLLVDRETRQNYEKERYSSIGRDRKYGERDHKPVNKESYPPGDDRRRENRFIDQQ